ncbi:MAG: ABC transporter permease [Proteobacteria bacterium]|nr:ABC transporter permease [Pseudomonadota bacterium]
MDIRPILSTLSRHKTAATLIVLEIAFSCAIICNALFLIGQRLERMQRPTGMTENQIVSIAVSGIATDGHAMATTRADLAALRAIPGVKSVASTNEVPFGDSSWNSGVRLTKDQTHEILHATDYLGDAGLFDTLGLKLVAGRKFLPDEFIDFDALNAPDSKVGIPAAILSRVTAEKLFPGQNPIGKTIYSWGEKPIRVVGVVEHLARPRDNDALGEYEYAMMLPVNMPYGNGGGYLLRTTPERRESVLKAAIKVLEHSGPTRIIDPDKAVTLEKMRSDYYRQDRTMAWLLVVVCIALLVVTALGIVGLASFWVQQRTRQIGVRRALGATRRQILHYFQIENFLLASIGIVLGMGMAFAINMLLMAHYELPRLPLFYLPTGALALWALGQLAVLAPAWRAAAVPPAVATRSV